MVTHWEKLKDLQFIRELSGGVYEICQVNEYESKSEQYRYKLCHGIVCRNEVDVDDIMVQTGCSEAELYAMSYREIAVLWFEMHIKDYWIAYPCFSYDEAKSVLDAMIAGDAAAGRVIQIS